MIKLKDLLKEDKFIAFYKNDRVTVTAKSLWDAKKQIIAKLKVPKKDVGLVSVLNKTEYDKQKFRFEGKLTEMNEPWFEITYKDSRGRKKTDSMRAKNPKEAKKDFVNLMKGRGFKVLKVVKEGKLTEGSLKRFKVFVSGEKEPLILLGKNVKDVKQAAYAMIQNSSIKVRKVVKESFGGVSSPPPFSSREAKKVVDDALRKYSKDLRKLQGKVVKDWMSKAKNGTIDFFDLVRGFRTGDNSRAYPYETEFLMSVLTKDKIIDRFRKYFGGTKAMKNRTATKRK